MSEGDTGGIFSVTGNSENAKLRGAVLSLQVHCQYVLSTQVYYHSVYSQEIQFRLALYARVIYNEAEACRAPLRKREPNGEYFLY